MPPQKKKKKSRLYIFEKLPCTTIWVTEAIGEDDVATKLVENPFYMLQFYNEKKKNHVHNFYITYTERERVALRDHQN